MVFGIWLCVMADGSQNNFEISCKIWNWKYLQQHSFESESIRSCAACQSWTAMKLQKNQIVPSKSKLGSTHHCSRYWTRRTWLHLESIPKWHGRSDFKTSKTSILVSLNADHRLDSLNVIESDPCNGGKFLGMSKVGCNSGKLLDGVVFWLENDLLVATDIKERY